MTSLFRNFMNFFLKPSNCKCCKKKTPDKEETAPKVPIKETPPQKIPVKETPPQKVPITAKTPPILEHKTYADASTQTTSDLMVKLFQIP